MTNNFKTAEQLRITKEEYNALLKTMEHLETHQPPMAADAGYGNDSLDYFNIDKPEVETRIGFNMGYEARLVKTQKFECGAVACIGGHMSLHMQGVPALSDGPIRLTDGQARQALLYVNIERSRALKPLFFPDQKIIGSAAWGTIRPDTAAHAIRGFLTTGGADWHQALVDGGQENLMVLNFSEDYED